MRKQLGGCCLAIVCVLLFSQLAAVQARGIKHRIKWNRKAAAPPSSSQVTEAQRVEMQLRPGAFIKHGRKLDIDFGAEANRYYEANYWQFPDEIHYNGCSEANVTREKFVGGCINATQAANQEELSQERPDNRLHRRILWRLVRELCSVKHCDFWLENGAGLWVAVDRPVMPCLLVAIWFIVK
ncbi:prion-like protein doppel [Myotis daubentonii]|uniref:prion-like protein doppel n=1 Tax=Myotis daubentonii TaxID=98922 RepID=UPI002873ECE1|nr:prion-like protein doppel [Myotis daubentonii]XP_059561605.1 prion-like protein doppel [Myotis daubentonii]